MPPQDNAHRRYVIDKVFPDGAWYLFLGDSNAPMRIGSLNDCLNWIRQEEDGEDWPDIPVLEPITRELAPAPDLGDLDMGDPTYEEEMRDAGRQHPLTESLEER